MVEQFIHIIVAQQKWAGWANEEAAGEISRDYLSPQNQPYVLAYSPLCRNCNFGICWLCKSHMEKRPTQTPKRYAFAQYQAVNFRFDKIFNPGESNEDVHKHVGTVSTTEP
eukprot:344824-Amorphochlora_amoeboformis.AAC.2